MKALSVRDSFIRFVASPSPQTNASQRGYKNNMSWYNTQQSWLYGVSGVFVSTPVLENYSL